jgi:hypothetical protein
MKTLKELEEIGIIDKYIDNGLLHIITKDRDVWQYVVASKNFFKIHTL